MKTIAVAVAVFAFTACASGPSPRAPITKPKPPTVETARTSGGIDLSGLDQVQVMKLLRDRPVRTNLKVCVTPSGQVSKAEILEGSGEEWLEEAILASVRNWTYRPFRSIAGLQLCHTVEVDLKS